MPVFGKTLFETVLDALESDEPEEDGVPPIHHANVLAADAMMAFANRDADDQSEGDFASPYKDFDEALPEVSQSVPDWLDRLSLEEITCDLNLTGQMSENQLRDRRRTFARLNHPDLVHPDYRAVATIRMTIANQLIDAALARLGRQA